MSLIALAVALAAPGGRPHAAPPKPRAAAPARITLDCDLENTNQVFASFGRNRFEQRSSRRTQRYLLDPAARQVTVVFQCGEPDSCNSWIEKPTLVSNVTFTPGGYVVYCPRTDNAPCNIAARRSSANGGTATVTIGQVIIDLNANKIMTWMDFAVVGADKSSYSDTGMTQGTCRRG